MAAKPSTYKRLMVHTLTTNFREAVTIETAEMCHPKKGEVCIKNKYVGINASDVNMTKGRYFTSGKPPFGVGFEAVGEIVEIGEDVDNFKVGQSVTYMNSYMNTYAEYVCVLAAEVIPVPEINPGYLTLLVSGLTAAIGLDKAARISAGDSVLITAAAGGTGHIAVQWAKAADCHVIGTCSTEEKEKVLKDLGCDRVINYKKEDLAEVLAKEYPKGVDVIWETIGGKVFEDCFKNLALRGRLLVIGGISAYKDEDRESVQKRDLSALPEQLLFKSASVVGFMLLHFGECFASYFKYMSETLEAGKIKVVLDNGEKSTGNEFFGMEGIIRGVEHLHSGKNVGKVYARIY
ncbi:prostaglandin reductase 3-like [Argiope bruennichi]|uniref:15-oxoprostaglandin 13-reductase n=1 Tax=Argiope bruennichi TaxID=94029 RepID=A0A8T0FNM6_ARGBR|nr:prostaglandin reductase 3-like [Argiope bruennichi]XP_055939012.1 prostaglandin reductase 3-like [Argiope bruennichi]XP_055939013.1 prostaglandin reductase 3-like [Argiope bruennichi]KAF8792486.1 Prostaglandin reductase 3 like protein [Argiope bruennichi]